MALTTELTHYYSTNSDFSDDVGSNDGTDTNTPTYTTGKISKAFTCASASSQYTSVANNTLPWGTNTVSINMWVKLSSVSGLNALLMVARSGQGMNIYYDGTNMVFSKPNVADCYAVWSGSEDTSYHMWTFVTDGTSMRIYLDGNSTPFATNANTANWVAPSTDTLPFGAYKSAGSLQAGWYLGGQLDEIGIWTRAITTTEISELYNSGDGFAYPFTTANTTNFFQMFN